MGQKNRPRVPNFDGANKGLVFFTGLFKVLNEFVASLYFYDYLCANKKDAMSREETNKLKYTIALIAEFADRFGLGEKQAFNYMQRFKGMQYLSAYYDVLHTQSFEDAIESMAIICKRNGGKLNPEDR